MFFVGHISIAFVLIYVIKRKFPTNNFSISFALFLSILPDIDIIFRFVGFDIGHRSITHSFILIAIVIFVLLITYKKRSLVIYSVAYLSHIIIGDAIVGPLDIVYPFGHLYLSSGIDFKTSSHLIIESFLVISMAIIIVGQYLKYRRSRTFIFTYTKLDEFFYPILLLAIIGSLVFLLDESQRELFEFHYSLTSLLTMPYNINATGIIILHALCLGIIIFLWIQSRRSYRSDLGYEERQGQGHQQTK
jgi:membrane-bound metal-dependent hydrolase YbcI (DUF457 family)